MGSAPWTNKAPAEIAAVRPGSSRNVGRVGAVSCEPRCCDCCCFSWSWPPSTAHAPSRPRAASLKRQSTVGTCKVDVELKPNFKMIKKQMCRGTDVPNSPPSGPSGRKTLLETFWKINDSRLYVTAPPPATRTTAGKMNGTS